MTREMAFRMRMWGTGRYSVPVDDELDRLAREEIVERGVAPAAVLGVTFRAGAEWTTVTGSAGATPDALADRATVFDLASVTKPFVAATYASLVHRGRIRPETELGSSLDEARGTTAEHTSLELLLSHRAGLLPHQPLFGPLLHMKPFIRRDALRTAAAARREEPLPDGSFPAVYSDLGYLLAGEALERAIGTRLDELVREHVARPLGLSAGSVRQWLRSNAEFSRRVAPTENVAFRGGVLRGVVHDENAWAFAGHGLAGHAGLFGTIDDVLRFGAALLDGLADRASDWLPKSAIAPLVRPRPNGVLRLGFDGKSGDESAAGPSASLDTFGHLGFTGTSLWCDPSADAVTAILTNRVYPTRDNLRIRSARPRVHEALLRHARPRSL